MKNNKVLYLIIIVLSVLVCLMGGFILGSSDIFSKNDNNDVIDNNDDKEDNIQVESKNEFKNINVDDQIISSAMNLVLNKNNSLLSSSCSFQYLVYLNYMEDVFNEKITHSDLGNNEKIQLIYENLSSDNKPSILELGKSYHVDSNVFNNTAKKVFGDNYTIPEEGYSSCSVKITYDNEKYVIEEALGGDQAVVSAQNSYVSAKMNEDTLIVIEKVEFLYPDFADDEIKQKYSKDLTLEYTFKKDSNNNFYWYSIENK